MLALRKVQAGFGAELVELPEPAAPPAEGFVRLRIAAAGICGSDLHAYDWTPGYEFMARLLPLTLGHEFAGVVTAVGTGVDALGCGDRVTCWPTVPCGSCAGCRAGRPDECSNRTVIGLHRDGAFCQFADVPAANCFPIPDDLPLDLAALAEPLAVAVNAVDLADVAPGEAVVVLGPGPIGLAAAWVAQQRGARVLLAGFDDAPRLDCARQLGLENTVDLAQEGLGQAVARIFGAAADKVIEATGHAPAVNEGLAALRPRGILVVAGIHKSVCELDLIRLVREKKQLRGAHDTTARAFREAIGLLARHGAVLRFMISHRASLSDAPQAFGIARDRAAVKVLLLPENEQDEGVA